MKKLILILLLLSATYSISFANVITVSNYVPSPGQFTDVLSASNAATDGDTIYIHGSPVIYPAGFGLSKRLTFIGAGMNPQKANAFKTTIGGNFVINSTAGFGSSFLGLSFTSAGIVFNTAGNQNVTVSRCYWNGNGGQDAALTFGSYPSGSGVNVNECVFSNKAAVSVAQGNQLNGMMISNCVFLVNNNPPNANFEPFYFINPNQGNGTALNWTISNCIFYGYNNGSNNVSSIISCVTQSITYNNCIFNKVYTSCMQNSTFNNCLTFGCNDNDPWLSGGNFNSGFNLSNTNPQFVNSGSINSQGLSLAPDWFGFTPTSPALVANHPGAPTEIGVYGGGTYNYANANASQLPFVYSLNIPTPNIQSGQNLQINVIGKKHD